MRTYKTMTDSDQKEKIVGGVLTLGQTMWIAGGFTVGLGMAFLSYSLFPSAVFAFFMIPAPLGIGAYMALKKIHGMSVVKYHMVKTAYEKQKQYVPNCRPQYMVDVKDYAPSTNIWKKSGNKLIKKAYLKQLDKDRGVDSTTNKKSSLFSLDADDDD